MVNYLIKYVGGVGQTLTFGFQHFSLAGIVFYYKSGEEVIFPYSDIMGCWLKLNGDYVIKVRRKVEYNRDEVFAVKRKGENRHFIYIPAEAVGLTHVGDSIWLDRESEYQYKANNYVLNGANLETFSRVDDIGTYSDGKIKFRVMVKCEPTEKLMAIRKLTKEIKDECKIELYEYQLKAILSRYNIIKKKNLK